MRTTCSLSQYNILLSKIDEIRHIAKLTNAAVIQISDSKSDNSVLTSEFELISMVSFVFTEIDMEQG